jgi:hypothetical protein
MAECKDIHAIQGATSSIFDAVLRPGAVVVHEGIYRCSCGEERVQLAGEQINGLHRDAGGNCKGDEWQLLVAITC